MLAGNGNCLVEILGIEPLQRPYALQYTLFPYSGGLDVELAKVAGSLSKRRRSMKPIRVRFSCAR